MRNSRCAVALVHNARMTPEDFVEVLRGTIDMASEGVVGVLRRPPGRAPWHSDLARSTWFNSLDAEGQAMVAGLVRSAMFRVLFNVCTMLDGVAAFDHAHGSLKLTYVGPDGSETLLNDPGRCELHAELRGDGPPP